jgi:hypothetical protein
VPTPDEILPEDVDPDDEGHIEHSRELHRFHNLGADAIIIPAVVDGVTDNTSMINDIIADAPAQSTIRFRDPGPVACGPWDTITKPLRIFGAGGRWSTQLVIPDDTDEPIIHFDVDMGTGWIFDHYGATVKQLGINMYDAPSATGLRISPSSHWADISHMAIMGGYQGVDHHGPNGMYARMFMQDASDCLFNTDEFGLGLHLSHMQLYRNVPGVTDAYIKCVMDYDEGTLLGSFNLLDVVGGANEAGGAVVNNGLIVSNTQETEMQVFGSQVVLDNVTGGGAGAKFVHIRQVTMNDGWINSATNGENPGGPTIEITGGEQYVFNNNRYFGADCTYEFKDSSDIPRGFHSKGNTCPTGPVYKVAATGRPTEIDVDDWCPGATVIGQITNDEDWFVGASRKRWGRLDLQQVPHIPVESIHVIGDPGEPSFQNGWANVPGTVAYFWKDPTDQVHIAGQVTGGSSPLIFTLPPGYRPFPEETFVQNTGLVQVLDTGTVSAHGTVGAVFLAGIIYRWGGG